MKPEWSDAPAWAKWLARDPNGDWNWYDERPTVTTANGGAWTDDGYGWMKAGNYGQSANGWERSLEPRP